MTRSALPEHLDEASEWKGTDWDTWYQRWMLPIHHWFAYGPRATEWWAKWREWPITVFAIKGKGPFRFEDDVRDFAFGNLFNRVFWWKHKAEYLSRIQYWCRWHFQIQWPLMVAFHVYYRAKDVPSEPHHLVAEPYNLRKMFYFYFGAHRDADKVYWFPSCFIGGCWK